MSNQMPARQSGGTAALHAAHDRQALTRPRSATGDRSTRYAGAISLAAAIGGTLLGVADEHTPTRQIPAA